MTNDLVSMILAMTRAMTGKY